MERKSTVTILIVGALLLFISAGVAAHNSKSAMYSWDAAIAGIELAESLGRDSTKYRVKAEKYDALEKSYTICGWGSAIGAVALIVDAIVVSQKKDVN